MRWGLRWRFVVARKRWFVRLRVWARAVLCDVCDQHRVNNGGVYEQAVWSQLLHHQGAMNGLPLAPTPNASNKLPIPVNNPLREIK